MDIPVGGPPLVRSAWRRRSPLLAALAVFWLLAGLPAAAQSSADLETQLGIAVLPGAELIFLEGPSPELIDLQRPGWQFVTADVTVADFLIDAQLSNLRRFYRPLCIRDNKLLLVRKEGPDGEIVSVRHARRHPLHPRKRWLRIVTYRRHGVDQRSGE